MNVDQWGNQIVDPQWNQQNAAYSPYMQNPYNLAPGEPVEQAQGGVPSREILAQQLKDEIAQELQKRAVAGTQGTPPTTSTPNTTTPSTAPTANAQGDNGSILDVLLAALGLSATASANGGVPGNVPLSPTTGGNSLPTNGAAPPQLPAQGSSPQIAAPAKQLAPPEPITLPDQTSGPVIQAPPAFDRSQARAINIKGQTYYVQNGNSVFDKTGRYMGDASKIVPRNSVGLLRTLGILSRAAR